MFGTKVSKERTTSLFVIIIIKDKKLFIYRENKKREKKGRFRYYI